MALDTDTAMNMKINRISPYQQLTHLVTAQFKGLYSNKASGGLVCIRIEMPTYTVSETLQSPKVFILYCVFNLNEQNLHFRPSLHTIVLPIY